MIHDAMSDAMNTVRDIMIVVGPPGPEEDKQRLEEWAASLGKPRDEVWVEYVHAALAEITKRDSPDSPSEFDALFSRMGDASARVGDPFLTYMLRGGIMCPGIILYPTKITSEAGEPLSLDFSNPEFRKALGAVFGYLFRTEWVHVFVAYDS
jgi:hypothetical protein